MKNVLNMEISLPFEMASDFHDNGLLSWNSYSALSCYSVHSLDCTDAKYSLVNLVLHELADPTKFNNFKDFLRIKLPMAYEVLSSMGEY